MAKIDLKNFYSHGFTIVELLIVLAITAATATAGFLSLSKHYANQGLELTLQEAAATLRETQRKSVTQQDGVQWNVHFTNNTSTVDTYEVYTGTSYATTSVKNTFQVRRNVTFSEPTTGTTTDISFYRVTGKTASKKVITMTVSGAPSIIADVIIDALGRVDAREDEGVVGYWHFDEGVTSTAYDASGRGNNAVATGTAWLSSASCKAGRCLDFDSTDYAAVSHSDSINVGNNFSVATWAKPTALSGTQEVVIKWVSGNYWFIRWVGTSLEFTPNADEANAVASSTVGAAGSWSFIVGTYDGSTSRLYHNGVLVSSKSYSGGTNQNSGRLGIGAIVDGTPTQYFTGVIDEVRVYNRTLSAQDVADLYEDLK